MENDDLELDLDFDTIEQNTERKDKVKNRFEQLSQKVILTAKERDEKAALVDSITREKEDTAKERDFYKDFSANVSKYPEASSYQEQILEKVKSGYSTEDAMVSVLAREGKLGTAQVQQEHHQAPVYAEGGSASTMMDGSKNIHDMSPEEKLSALAELEKDGSLASALRGGR